MEWIMNRIVDFFLALWQLIYTLSYWIACFGGLIAILLYICGHKQSLKWMWTAVIGYVLLSVIGA